MLPQVQADRVVVRPIAAERKTASGFYINVEAGTPARATVLAVGPGAESKKGVLIPMTVAVGDIVRYTDGLGIKVNLNGEDLLVLKEEDIFGVEEQ